MDNLLRDQPKVDLEYLKEEVYDIIRTIQDPEKPFTLEDLDVVNEDLISVESIILCKQNKNNMIIIQCTSLILILVDEKSGIPVINIIWVPTTPDCHLATTIALCLRTKLFKELSYKDAKIDIFGKNKFQEGKHSIKKQIDKQVNDKERVLAAMENESIKAAIEDLIKERQIY